MDRRAIVALQKLSNLPPEIFARVAEVLVGEFSVPQPSIAKTVEALTGHTGPKPRPSTTHPKSKGKSRPKASPGAPSRAAQVRDLLQSGPKTTAEIESIIKIPHNQIHPVLAAIGARPMGEVEDDNGDKRKVYGLPGSMVRDEAGNIHGVLNPGA